MIWPRIRPSDIGDDNTINDTSHSVIPKSARTRPFSFSFSLLTLLSFPVLLGLPFYYSSGASYVLQRVTIESPTYEAWINANRHTIDVYPARQATNHDDDPGLTLGLRSMSEPLQKIQEAWNSYIEARIAEWKVIFTITCILSTISLTCFQIPETTKVPLIRALATLALSRAFSSLIYGPIFFLYFRSPYTRTTHFAVLWSKDCLTAKPWNPWVMISLPAASTLWAFLLNLSAILSFTLRSTDPEVEEYHMRPQFIIALRTVVILSMLMDVLCLMGVCMTLRRYRAECHSIEGAAGV